MKIDKLSGVLGDPNFGTTALAGTSTVANLNGVRGLNASQWQNYLDVLSDYKPIFFLFGENDVSQRPRRIQNHIEYITDT